MKEKKKTKGRPKKILTPEEIEAKVVKRKEYLRRYGQNRNVNEIYYYPRLTLPLNSKEKINDLRAKTNLSFTQIAVDAIKKVYGVDLQEK